MGEARFLADLRQTLGRFQGEGLYTHAFAAAGRFAEPTPRVKLLLSADGRDVFDLASLTKALVTTPLVFREILRGRVSLQTSVGEWLGAAGANLAKPLQQLTVQALLAHTSGLPAWRNFWMCALGADTPRLDWRERSRRIVSVLNRFADEINPAQGQLYSDLGFILLGHALETALGVDLSEAFEALLTEELGLDGATLPLQFATHLELRKRGIPTSRCAVRQRELFGEVHDENCASLGSVAGHAGLFATGDGLVQYLGRLRASKVGQALWQANAAARVLPVGSPANESLVGFRQGADPSSIVFGDGAAMGHMGFTGVAFWVVPETDTYGIYLTNRVKSGRTKPGIAASRREIFGLLAAFVQ